MMYHLTIDERCLVGVFRMLKAVYLDGIPGWAPVCNGPLVYRKWG